MRRQPHNRKALQKVFGGSEPKLIGFAAKVLHLCNKPVAQHSQLSCFVACTALCLAQACEFLRILLCGTKLHITDGLCLATAYVLSLLSMLGARQQKSICAHVLSLPNMLYIQTL